MAAQAFNLGTSTYALLLGVDRPAVITDAIGVNGSATPYYMQLFNQNTPLVGNEEALYSLPVPPAVAGVAGVAALRLPGPATDPGRRFDSGAIIAWSSDPEKYVAPGVAAFGALYLTGRTLT